MEEVREEAGRAAEQSTVTAVHPEGFIQFMNNSLSLQRITKVSLIFYGDPTPSISTPDTQLPCRSSVDLRVPRRPSVA